MTVTVITSWQDLCDYLQKHKKDSSGVTLKVKSIYGSIDRKVDADASTIKKIEAITLEVI